MTQCCLVGLTNILDEPAASIFTNITLCVLVGVYQTFDALYFLIIISFSVWPNARTASFSTVPLSAQL